MRLETPGTLLHWLKALNGLKWLLLEKFCGS